MDILFSHGEATVKQVQAELSEAPTEMAVRRLLQILMEKGLLRSRKQGRAVIYEPKQSRKKAGASALRHVLDTFFGGAVDEALATHLASKETLTTEQIKRLKKLIREASENEK